MEAPIDLKALLVEREDCDAGTVQKLREGLAQGGAQFRALREVVASLTKKLEASPPAVAKKLHLKLGIANYFLGFMSQSAENLKHAEVPLGYFYHGRALANLQQFDEALKALDRAEKSGYSAPQVQLQRANVHRLKGDLAHATGILGKLEELASHSAEFHYQKACCMLSEGTKPAAIKSLEKSLEFDPGHTGALFQLGYFNDLAGNDAEAIQYYERCLKYPPVHRGTLNNLGVLYEDSGKYDKAVECFGKLLSSDPTDDRARLFHKDASASVTMYYNPEEEQSSTIFRQVLEVPVTDFELSVRSRNCLKKMGIRTLGDLTRITEASLLASKNFGETSLDEIKHIMTAKGLRIGQSLEQGANYDVSRFRQQSQLTPEEQAMLNRPVSELNLSVRARKCMNRLSILTLGELVGRTADELLEAKNFGQTSLVEIRDKLTELGLKLRGD